MAAAASTTNTTLSPIDTFLFITDVPTGTKPEQTAAAAKQSDSQLSWSIRIREWMIGAKYSLDTPLHIMDSAIRAQYGGEGLINVGAEYYNKPAPSVLVDPTAVLSAFVADWKRYELQVASNIGPKAAELMKAVTFRNIESKKSTRYLKPGDGPYPVLGLRWVRSGAGASAGEKEKELEPTPPTDSEYTTARRLYFDAVTQWINTTRQSFPPCQTKPIGQEELIKAMTQTVVAVGLPIDPVPSFELGKEASAVVTEIQAILQYPATLVAQWNAKEPGLVTRIRQEHERTLKEDAAATRDFKTALTTKSAQMRERVRVQIQWEQCQRDRKCLELVQGLVLASDGGGSLFPTTLTQQVRSTQQWIRQFMAGAEAAGALMEGGMDDDDGDTAFPLLWQRIKLARLNRYRWTFVLQAVAVVNEGIRAGGKVTLPNWSPGNPRDEQIKYVAGEFTPFLDDINRVQTLTLNPDWRTVVDSITESYHTFVTKTLPEEQKAATENMRKYLIQSIRPFSTTNPLTPLNRTRLQQYLDRSDIATLVSMFRLTSVGAAGSMGQLASTIEHMNQSKFVSLHVFLEHVAVFIAALTSLKVS